MTASEAESMRGSGRRSRAGAVILALWLLAGVLSLTACGGDDDGDGEGSGSQQTVTLNIAGLPIGNIAPQYLGARKGIFREEGIEVKPALLQSGNEVITSMISGSNQMGFVGYVPAMVAQSQGLPIKIVANADNGALSAEDEWTKIVVPADSGIRDVADLAGKTVAANSLKGVGEVVIKASLEKQGVDPSSIKLLEIPFPEMPTALEAERVDATWITEPFLSQVMAQGARAVDAPLTTLGKEYVNGCYVVTDEYLEKNPDVVERFVRAMNRSLDYARAHPEEARAEIPKFTQIPPDAAKEILLPRWPSEIDNAQVEQLGEYGQKYDVVGENLDVDDLIWEGATTK